MLTVVLLFGASLFIGPAALGSYDEHRIDVVCDVTKSDGQVRSSSYRGIGSSSAQVVLRTDDCGDLIMVNGVTRSNYETVAREIVPGEHIVQVGGGSWGIRKFLRLVNISPEAFSVCRVDAAALGP